MPRYYYHVDPGSQVTVINMWIRIHKSLIQRYQSDWRLASYRASHLASRQMTQSELGSSNHHVKPAKRRLQGDGFTAFQLLMEYFKFIHP